MSVFLITLAPVRQAIMINNFKTTENASVNSFYCGHSGLPRGRELMSLVAGVRNSGNLFQSNVCNLFLPRV